jgi:hypothetical protein
MTADQPSAVLERLAGGQPLGGAEAEAAPWNLS